MRKLFYKSYVNVYRVTAMMALYGMFAAITGYAALMGFYSVNKSWVAPLLISPSNDKILYHTDNFVFRSEYEISTDVTSFFSEQDPALDRVAKDFAQRLVAAVVENY